MSCNKCKKDPCNSCECCEKVDCGCKEFYDSACVRFNKKDLSCIGKPQGTDLEQIIESIDEKLCGVSDGADGLSAYEVAVSGGFEGTEQEWLDSLQGSDGEDCDCTPLEEYGVNRDGFTPSTSGWEGTETDPVNISFEVVSSVSYTLQSSGSFDISISATARDVTYGSGSEVGHVAIAVFVNSSLLTSSSPAWVGTSLGNGYHYSPLNLDLREVALTVGDEIQLYSVSSNNQSFRPERISMKIKKLP